MMAGAVIALVWVNVDPPSYERITHPLHFLINDVAMAFFFGLAVKEIIEATAPGGALHSWRHAALPVVAAVGGMAGPALIYAGQALAFGRPDALRGWAIPCATDIAFSYLVIRLIVRPTHPAVSFLLLLAIADDALGLVLLAVFYPSADVQPLHFVVLVGLSCVIAWQLRVRRTRSFWPYILVAGTVSWAGFYIGGLHPALALVPVLPFVPRAERDAGLYVEGDATDALSRFQNWFSTPVEFVLFFFALANAGVRVGSSGVVTWIVLVALVAGKPIGILAFTWLAERFGFRRAKGLVWRDVLVLGTLAGIGFTVALFFATAAFPAGGRVLDEVKMGALFSFVAAPIGVALSRIVRGRRPAPPPTAAAHSPRS